MAGVLVSDLEAVLVSLGRSRARAEALKREEMIRASLAERVRLALEIELKRQEQSFHCESTTYDLSWQGFADAAVRVFVDLLNNPPAVVVDPQTDAETLDWMHREHDRQPWNAP